MPFGPSRAVNGVVSDADFFRSQFNSPKANIDAVPVIASAGVDTATTLDPCAFMMQTERNAERGLKWIGAFKLCMGLLLAVVASGVLSLIHRDVEAVVDHWVNLLRFDPENRHIAALLGKLDLVNDRELRKIGALTFVYAGLLLTEGVGLLMKQRWAEYLTVIATGSFIPLEVHEVVKRFGFGRLSLLIINVGIVWFLFRSLRRKGAS